MNHDRTYRPVPHVPAPRLRGADDSMRQAPRRSAGYAAIHPVPPLKGLPGTRATDVSYRALAPGGAGIGRRVCTGTSESRLTAHYSLLTANSTYTFSAKERDPETGLSYFGSRYYSSDLSVWLSVDPMASKYPSLSPYTYCANNPIKLVDPNGEAFDTEIDEANQTITIHAVYYTTKKDAVPLKKELEAWKKKGESFCYISEGKEYSVHFNLEIRDFDDVDKAIDEFGKNKDDGVSNYFQINKTVENPKHESVNGINYEGNNMYVTKGQIRSIRHEIGHSLGLGDWDHGLMKSGGAIYGISKNNIISIFENAGIRSQIHNFWGDWGNRQTDPICTSKTTYNKLGLFKRKHNH